MIRRYAVQYDPTAQQNCLLAIAASTIGLGLASAIAPSIVGLGNPMHPPCTSQSVA